ncbi:MAG TPA: aminomethyl-transferring glycine dehydrogenase subunit GcvPB [Steroidobacteraceae bacterium]|jgi:glycine dehydrogenase subunit 2|nr:aminomethyl-transferring glycine dehydrogenase subunit GcvPB [Steroidobacteraceae bacterium]
MSLPPREKLIFEYSRPGRGARAQWPAVSAPAVPAVPAELRRTQRPLLPEVSELDVVRHYTRLSQLNFSIDTHFYPLGSCTMKYNPKACNAAALLPEFAGRHPLASAASGQGFMACMYELQEMLKAVTGMRAVALSPLAGAHGEFAGVAMIRAYQRARGESERNEIIVPQAAHGTNPATASMCGCIAREVAVGPDGDVDLDGLRAAVGPRTAGIMLTNPSTLGVFERRIEEVARIVHESGGLLYYDGANLNAILGKVRPGDMAFDAIHMNLHKTFSTPHGGGGPGAGAVGVSARLLPFLPLPIVAREADETYRWLTERDLPQSIGRLTTFAGNAGVLLRAYVYMRMLGREGMRRVGEYATLNANYLAARLTQVGFDAAYPQRRASHEFILTLRRQAQEYGVTAMDVAKRLLDLGFHAPTTYFPQLVSECLLIEPTETESKETLDAFVAAMAQILREAREEPERLQRAPHTLPVRRLDDVRAAREPDLIFKSDAA